MLDTKFDFLFRRICFVFVLHLQIKLKLFMLAVYLFV